MALTIQPIPVMSSKVERAFSSSKLLISNHSNYLGYAVISAVECLKSWDTAGFIEMNEIRQVEDLLFALENERNR